MTPDDTISGPWYRHFWPWFIVLLLGTTVCAGILTVAIAFRGADSLVGPDAYRSGQHINRALAADREAALREARAVLRNDPRLSVTLDLLGEPPEALALELSHVTRSALDQSFQLERRPDGSYSGPGRLPEGAFYLTLRPVGLRPSWRLRRRVHLPGDEPLSLVPIQ